MSDEEKIEPEGTDEDIHRMMKDHSIDEGTAERAQELMDEGLDEDEAIEIAEEGL